MNLGGVLLLALLGTTLNIFAIGFYLFATFGRANEFTALECLLLSAMISEVDPEAVLNQLHDPQPAEKRHQEGGNDGDDGNASLQPQEKSGGGQRGSQCLVAIREE